MTKSTFYARLSYLLKLAYARHFGRSGVLFHKFPTIAIAIRPKKQESENTLTNPSQYSMQQKCNIASKAFEAARKCREAGGFLRSEVMAITFAIEVLNPPIPAVKVNPIEWKEMTAAGHKPGTWPHILSHMRDIAFNDKTVASIRDRINTILDQMNELDKHIDSEEWSALSEERNRLVRYRTFLESIVDDVAVVMEQAKKHFEKLLRDEERALAEQRERARIEQERIAAEQAAAQAAAEAKAKAEATKMAEESDETKRLTSQVVYDTLIELCHGRVRSVSTRYAAERRVMELIHVGAMNTAYMVESDGQDDVDDIIHDFVRETIEHDRHYDDVENTSGAAWVWMKNTFHTLANEHREVNGPMGFYTTAPMEAATTEDVERYSSVDDPKIDYYAHFVSMMLRELPKAVSEEDLSRAYDLAEAEANALIKRYPRHAKIIDKCFNTASDDLYNRFFNGDRQKRVHEALVLLQSRLNPWFNTWTGPIVELEPGPKKSQKSKKQGRTGSAKPIPAPPPSGRFENDALRLQLAQVVKQIEDGNVPTAQA